MAKRDYVVASNVFWLTLGAVAGWELFGWWGVILVLALYTPRPVPK